MTNVVDDIKKMKARLGEVRDAYRVFENVGEIPSFAFTREGNSPLRKNIYQEPRQKGAAPLATFDAANGYGERADLIRHIRQYKNGAWNDYIVFVDVFHWEINFIDVTTWKRVARYKTEENVRIDDIHTLELLNDYDSDGNHRWTNFLKTLYEKLEVMEKPDLEPNHPMLTIIREEIDYWEESLFKMRASLGNELFISKVISNTNELGILDISNLSENVVKEIPMPKRHVIPTSTVDLSNIVYVEHSDYKVVSVNEFWF